MKKLKAKELGSSCISRAALQIFFSISDKWDLSDEQEKVLLGSPADTDFAVWKENTKEIFLNKATLERVSHLMIIYHNLRALLSGEDAANSWIKQSNSAPLFSGDTALNYMLNGGLAEMEQVHVYLDGELM